MTLGTLCCRALPALPVMPAAPLKAHVITFVCRSSSIAARRRHHLPAETDPAVHDSCGVDQQWSSCGLSYASLPESRAILLDGPPPATTQRRIAKVLDQAELAWFDALAATTIAE